jgi:hypothetical protein
MKRDIFFDKMVQDVGSWENHMIQALEHMFEEHLRYTTTTRLDALLTQHNRPYTLKNFSFFKTWAMPPNKWMPNNFVNLYDTCPKELA